MLDEPMHDYIVFRRLFQQWCFTRTPHRRNCLRERLPAGLSFDRILNPNYAICLAVLLTLG